MIQNIILAVLVIMVVLYSSMTSVKECPKEPYEQNQMVDGCVMQKSGGTWIRTCG
jgi:hypothetical protein